MYSSFKQKNEKRIPQILPLKKKKDTDIDVSLSTQTELKQGFNEQKPIKVHKTLILSNDYVIKYPTCQPANICWNIENEFNKCLFVKNRFQSSKNVNDMDLSPGAIQILNLPNAGGNSLESEVLSFELLNRCYGAQLLKTEMEIEYYPSYSKKTDYSVTIYGKRIGVSVTRAMKFGSLFTRNDAIRLLEKKLFGIIISSQNVLKRHGWEKQILHIWASHIYIGDIIEEEFNKLPNSLRVDTILIVTICTADSLKSNVFTSNHDILDYIFYNHQLQ